MNFGQIPITPVMHNSVADAEIEAIIAKKLGKLTKQVLMLQKSTESKDCFEIPRTCRSQNCLDFLDAIASREPGILV